MIPVMRFESSDDATNALAAAGIEAVASAPGVWRGAVKIPNDLQSLEDVILSDRTSDSAKVFAGTLLVLARTEAVDGVFAFSVSVYSQAAGPTQNGE